MRRRVLSLLLSAGSGGLEAVAFQYAKVLAEAGCESALAANRKSPYVADSRVRLFGVPGASLVNPFNHLAVARAVREFRPDVVIGHGSRGADFCKSPFVRRAAPRDTRFIGVLHGENARHFGGLDKIIAVSERLRIETVAKNGFDPCHVISVPNAVALPDLAEDRGCETRGRIPVIGFLGRFDPCKGLDVLLRACARVRSEGVDFRLDIGGSGPQEGELRRLAADLGLGSCVRWLGWVTDKRAFFGDIDLFVMPSREEAVGLVMLEAMAHRRAVVLSDCPGPKEIVGACGKVFPRGNDEVLSETLVVLLKTSAARAGLASAGRNLVASQYSEGRLAARLMNVLNGLPT